MLKNQFYVYVHCLPTGKPFYVGKGSGGRAYQFIRRSKNHQELVKRYGKNNILIYIFNCDSEKEAHRCEKWMISWCYFQGYKLVNKSSGGEGVAGRNKVKFPISGKDRQIEFKKRMRSAGFIQTAVWVHHTDFERVKKYVDRLRRQHDNN